MKTIGMIMLTEPGGSCCLKHINALSSQRYGDNPIVYSVLLAKADYQHYTEHKLWPELAQTIAQYMVDLANKVDFFIMPSNTPHYCLTQIREGLDAQGYEHKPILNIVDEVAKRSAQLPGVKKILVLGTRATMQDGLYKADFDHYQLTYIIPMPDDQEIIHTYITKYLIHGAHQELLRQETLRIIKANDCQAVILACTELPTVINNPAELPGIKLIDTTELLAQAAIEYANH